MIRLVFSVPLAWLNNTNALTGERHGPQVHAINNANPYQGIPITEGHGKYPVIFEPLQNVQTSRLTYKITSFIDFTPYLEYFECFEQYLEEFKTSLQAFKRDPVMQEFLYQKTCETSDNGGRHVVITLHVMCNL